MRAGATAVRAVVGLLAFALVAEVAARITLAWPGALDRIGGRDEASWRLRWTERHRRDAEIFYRFDVYHPTRGWALAPNLHDLPVFDHKTLGTNSRGLRGRAEFPEEPAPGRTRIVILGDSFAFGEEVSDDETLAAELERTLPGADVLNLGVHGYGHDQMLVYFREEGRRYRPRVVILGFVFDDLDRNVLTFRDFAKPRFVVDAKGRLVLTGTPVPTPETVLAREPFRLKVVDLLVMARAAWEERSSGGDRGKRELGRSLLGALAAEIRDAGAAPLFVFFPTRPDIQQVAPAITRSHETFLADVCRALDVGCLSLRPVFVARARQGVRLTLGWHWSPEGHHEAAAQIRGYLLQNRLVTAPVAGAVGAE